MAGFTSWSASRAASAPRRDTLRMKLYEAEADTGLAGGELLRTLADVKKYVDRVTDLAVFRRRWGSRTIRALQKRNGGAQGYAKYHEVHVSLPCSKWTALHEIAHVIVALPPEEQGNHHGPTFRRTLLELVGFEFGAAAAEAFRAALKKRKLRLGSPTPLRATVPDPRPVIHAWRIQLGKDELLMLQGTSLASVLTQLSLPPYAARFRVADATEIRIWKSRAASSTKAAASKGTKP